MHDHLHDELTDPLRPRADRAEDHHDTTGLAAASGRVEVLGARGTLDLQRLAGNAAVAQLLADDEERAEDASAVTDVIGSAGRPLEPEVRTDMESRLGADFGDVRIHDDAAATDSARAVQAHAYTVGSDVVFQRDRYDPSSDSGRLTLAHELTHVIQQRSGPVDGTEAPGGIKISDPGDRFEREASANAERVMAVQREGEDEEDEEALQGSFVQRQTEDEEPLEAEAD